MGEKLFDGLETTCQSSQICCSSRSTKKSEEKSTISNTEEGQREVEVNKPNEEIEIKIQFGGHSFKTENLNVQVINDSILAIKAENDDEKFERKFKLSSNTLVEKIESTFDVKEEDVQTLIINIPKDIKVVQVPIAMDE